MANKVLNFVKWYSKTAVYLGDDLIFYGSDLDPSSTLLTALGYDCRHFGEVPTYEIPPEMDKGGYKQWQPPEKLSALKEQFRKWKLRVKREELARAEQDMERIREEIEQMSDYDEEKS